jgi:16S rRNA (cytosine1407-C5)-methyltransferase
MKITKFVTPVERLPQILVDRLMIMFPGGEFHSVVNGFSVHRPTTIRANSLKISGRELKERFQQDKIHFDVVNWYGDALILSGISRGQLSRRDEYKNGSFYVQSLSSMLPVLVLQPKPGENVLDLCAAPGSKTTQMAAMMKNQGTIVAYETNPIRTDKLVANLTIQGVTNVNIETYSGEKAGERYPNYFDAVLVDAPCSGEGRINIYDHGSFRGWSVKKIKDYSILQKRLLISAIFATKPGGRIVYSTCTLAPEENEGVIDYVMTVLSGKVALEYVSLPGLKISPSFTSWNGKTYIRDISKSVRVFPSALMEGFYIAMLRKI